MEGPSLAILREELAPFRGRKVLQVTGNTKQPKESLRRTSLQQIHTWGKVLFLTFSPTQRSKAPIVVRTHFMMFGSYSIGAPKPGRTPRLEMRFRNGTVYFYACSVKFGGSEFSEHLDPRVDLMSEQWEQGHVIELMKRELDTYLCDLFLDQQIFAGSGNIVKNEVLFNIRRHPLTRLSQISKTDWPKLATAVHDYCWNFYEWKKKYELRRHWQVYRQTRCPLCNEKLTREHLGKFLRRTFYCPRHQPSHSRRRKLEVFPVLPMKRAPALEPGFDH